MKISRNAIFGLAAILVAIATFAASASSVSIYRRGDRYGEPSVQSGGNVSGNITIQTDPRRDPPPEPQRIIVQPDPPPPPYIPPRYNYFRTSIRTDRPSYYVGESVRLYFSASEDAYVYIFNTDSRGETRQIFPNYYDRDNFVRGGRQYSIPNRGYALAVAGPAGRESVRIVAYRERYRALSSWENYTQRDPFPIMRSNVESKNSRVQSEARAKSQNQSRSSAQRLEIVPVPDRGYYYAENWAYFSTFERYQGYPTPYYPPYPGIEYPPYSQQPPIPFGQIRVTSNPTDANI